MLLLLAAVLVVLFSGCLLPGHTLFSNDGPLGTQVSACHRLPAGFTGTWEDLNSIGSPGPGFLVSITYILLFLLGPFCYAKFYAPIALLLLGLGAWSFFKKLGLSQLACILGGLAAMLNSIYFSTACWGVAGHPLAVGMSLFALGLLVDPSRRLRWVKAAVAGLAVGVGVADGTDVGGIFSMFVAAFAVYWAVISDGRLVKNLGTGLARLMVVIGFAVFFAAHAISVVPVVAGGSSGTRSKADQWDWATQWSLPKREALSIIVPGLFGYRMDSPENLPEWLQEHYVGGNYWGAAGRDPVWDRYFDGGKQGPAPDPRRLLRYSGGGPYAGILVALTGVWAAVQACRKRESVFPASKRKHLWFWVTAAAASLLLAFGRFAPFYQFIFPLPYFHNIRNPAKFLEIFSLALIVLFAHGIDVLDRRSGATLPSSGSGGFRNWWAKAATFDRRWIAGCIITFAACVVGRIIYASHRADLERYLQTMQFPEGLAHDIASFSIGQVGWFLMFLAVGVVLFIAALSGRFAGQGAKWGGILLGLFLVIDLGRANLPWIIFVDYANKNEVAAGAPDKSSNPVIEYLRQQPYEHRVSIAPYNASGLGDLYRVAWMQHQFQYFNIQCLDSVQMPRAAEDFVAFESAFSWNGSPEEVYHIARHWQLTNTRYLLGPAGALNDLNKQFDPVQRRFGIAARFNIAYKPGIARPRGQFDEVTAVIDANGPFAIFDYGAALPRAKLYSRWQVSTNDQATLGTLASQQFDPEQSVLVDTPIPASTASTNAGNVSFVSYAPKNIKFKAEAAGPSVLLLNDRFDPNWKVFVDGKREPLLRCNFIMRGVQVPSGQHQVEFRFEPPVRALYVSVAAVFVGLALVGCLLFLKEPVAPELRPQPAPAREKARA